jgi:hypothetical protein
MVVVVVVLVLLGESTTINYLLTIASPCVTSIRRLVLRSVHRLNSIIY